jgi:hypothetical protein
MTLTPARRHEIHRTLTEPPRPDEAPDLNRLRTLLDAYPRRPWWLDVHLDEPTGEWGDAGGVLAYSTPEEVTRGADEIHELGGLHPVNAAPWLLDRLAELGADAETKAAAIAAVRDLCARHQADAVGGGLTDIETIRPSEVLETLRTAGDKCGSTFVVPGDPDERVRRCDGRPGHLTLGVMHGGDGAAWADNAAADQHPGEVTVIRLSQYRKLIRAQQSDIEDAAARFRALFARHQPQPARSDPAVELCAGCGKVWPCPDSEIIGTATLTVEQIAAVLRGPQPTELTDDAIAAAADAGGFTPPAEPVVTSLTTLQFAWGGLFGSTPADYLIHLVRNLSTGGTSTSTLCDIDRTRRDGPGFAVGGGVDGPDILLTPCPGCVAKARAEFAGLKISGSVGSDKIRAAVAAGQDAAK